jgi:hypothetical protein
MKIESPEHLSMRDIIHQNMQFPMLRITSSSDRQKSRSSLWQGNEKACTSASFVTIHGPITTIVFDSLSPTIDNFIFGELKDSAVELNQLHASTWNSPNLRGMSKTTII